MLRNLKNRLKNILTIAIDWRVRDVLEVERQSTIMLGQTFIEGAAHITDQQRLLELQVSNLEKRIAELENRK
jgi:hypothetical protein